MMSSILELDNLHQKKFSILFQNDLGEVLSLCKGGVPVDL